MTARWMCNKMLVAVTAAATLFLALGSMACSSQSPVQHEVQVAATGSDETGDGTPDAPYATVSCAAKAAPGSVIVVHGGEYGPIELRSDCSGSADSPTAIHAAEGESVIVHANDGACISLVNTCHILIEGLETEGGTHGIEYVSTRDAGGQPLEDISISDCVVHGVRGVHGICVYAQNDLAPVKDICIVNCEVYDCECGSSESVVINGNVDGFLIAGNTIHDNNNIGIDMIGFEGTAKHPSDDGKSNPYEVDMARNGMCRNNVVYNISTEGNPAYAEGGGYDLCAGGIYVDGGRDIEICENFIFNCDIGLEVATEHNPKDNELFRVTGIRVHDNVIANCSGWAGICFGGYDADRGYTEDCEFDHNTLVDNLTQIAVQHSRNNWVHANLVLGGDTGVEFSEDCLEEDLTNNIDNNVAAGIDDEDSWDDEFGKLRSDRADVAEGFRSLIADVGSRFIPDAKMMDAYDTQCGR